MSTSVKDWHIFEKHVESTLILVAIHRCKICNFYSPHSGVMSDHMRTSHAQTTGEDVARIPEETLQRQESDIPLQSVLKEIQNLDCFRSMPQNQVVLKILSNWRTETESGRFLPHQSTEEVSDSEANLDSFYKFLVSESMPCRSEKSSSENATSYGKDILEERQQLAEKTSSQKAKSDLGNSIISRNPWKNSSEESRAQVAKTDNYASIAASAIKLDFNRAYLSMLDAAKLTSKKKKVKKATVEGEGLISESPIVGESHSLDADLSHGQAPGSIVGPVQALPQLTSLEAEAVSKKEEAGSSDQEKNPQNDVRSNQSGEINKDASAGPSTGEDMATSPGDRNQEQVQNGERPAPQTLPSVTLEGSKLYGSVDFQAIAQRASQSNPEATTITVVQHTGGNRPPTTIHFKKSLKSEAIIPTGESLGIESPFLRKEYTGSKIFACKECHSRYKTANELERHIVKKHQKKKSYLCEICGDALATRSGMKTHIMRKHAITDVLSCNVCDYMTRSSARLKIHMKKHNKETSDFYCEPCKKSFVTESKLQQHKHSPMHKNAVDPIICEHCGYVTKKRDNFLVHIRKHTGEKPYRCNHCDYAAADGSTLKRHVMARHSSIRPFRCTQCQFSCVDKKGLTVHMRKHTGERPFMCDLCPYAAKRSGALTVHRRTHFHDKPSERSPKEDLTVDGGTEVASYVDISDIPIAHVPLTSLTPSGNYPAHIHVSTQNPATSRGSSLPSGHQGMATNQSTSASVQLPPEVISTQETDQSVRALWQSIS